MCSIMGYCGSGATFDDFKKGFDHTVSRGPDDSRIIDTGKGLLGFHRLSIMLYGITQILINISPQFPQQNKRKIVIKQKIHTL